MPYCSNCGSPYKFGKEKCSNCGAELPKADSFRKLNVQSTSVENIQKDSKVIPVASIAKRISAGIVDLLVGIGLISFIMLVVVFRLLARRFLIRGLFAFIIIYFLSSLYFLFRDSLRGKSIGKLIFALTAINTERIKPADLADSILRNSVLGIIAIPIIGWAIFLIIAIIILVQISIGKEQRIGDVFAHTKVIEDKYLDIFY